MPRRIREIQSSFLGQKIPNFASTPNEIRRAVERGAIQRGALLIKVIVSLNFDELLDTVKRLSENYDKEDFYERYQELGIDQKALSLLDNIDPPIPYSYYFSNPLYLTKNPELIMYYRNVAMLSKKVMNGIGLNTAAYEERGVTPTDGLALELSKYFNGIISKLILISGITPNRHLEMALTNIGDSLGGISRNEVGRAATAQVINYIAKHLHKLGYLESITYILKDSLEDEVDQEPDDSILVKLYTVTPETDIDSFLRQVEDRRVKYQELILKNGYKLLLDRQLSWRDSESKVYKIGPDLHTISSESDMFWAGEIKGGADPAGSDEHWKTATQALNRIIDAAEATNRPLPRLSFFATILVERVATEVQQWINDGKLSSVYNLTQISENNEELQKFLGDMTNFLGYKY